MLTMPGSAQADRAKVVVNALVADVDADARGQAYDSFGVGFLPELTVRYSRILPLTVVAAMSNVISQWVDNTRQFTDLRWFIIEEVRSLRRFETMFRRGEIEQYDVIFIKIGTVTNNFVVDGEPPPEGTRPRSLFEAFNRITEGVAVQRVIYDDYDMAKLTRDDCHIRAGFIWLISATRRTIEMNHRIKGGGTTANFLRDNTEGFPLIAVALDDIPNRVFNLRCDKQYVDAYISSTVIGYRRVYVRGGWAARVLRVLGVAPEVAEMINAGALRTAAGALRIDAASPAELIRRVVGRQFEELHAAKRTQLRVAQLRRAMAARRTGATTVPIPTELLRDLRRAILEAETDEEIDTAYQAAQTGTEQIHDMFDRLVEAAEATAEKNGRALERMRGNIREGCCQVCKVPFDNDGGSDDGGPGDHDGAINTPGGEGENVAAFILIGCCQVVVCEHCIIDGQQPNARRERSFLKRCPTARATWRSPTASSASAPR